MTEGKFLYSESGVLKVGSSYLDIGYLDIGWKLESVDGRHNLVSPNVFELNSKGGIFIFHVLISGYW